MTKVQLFKTRFDVDICDSKFQLNLTFSRAVEYIQSKKVLNTSIKKGLTLKTAIIAFSQTFKEY